MKILRYSHGGVECTGILCSGGIVDVSSKLPELDDLRRALTPEGQHSLVELAESQGPDHTLDDVTLLAPLHPAARLFCVGKNFRDHVAETGGDEAAQPRVFLRTHESVVGPGGTLVHPETSESFDYEGELAVVIGTSAASVDATEALDHVGAYTCFNDGSVREYQRHTTTAGKNFDRSGAIGPWLVTADEVGDPTALELTTTLNGEEVQAASIDTMIYSIPRVIEYLSVITTLMPGDVISMGTPSGVGQSRTPPRWLRVGDRLDVEVSRVGVLTMVVSDQLSFLDETLSVTVGSEATWNRM
jgi:2-keto-4-pentenoate hydratase/2-oxohepta-3-ene-1,7-dioic acid hydratase in catechol pathway